MVSPSISSFSSKLALFSAGVFFHGAADHVMVAVTGSAPDVASRAAIGSTIWVLAAFNFCVAAVLYFGHRRLEDVRHGSAHRS